MALLSIQNADLGYEGKAVITDVTFDVNAGDYICIVGENGAGKSTLMKTILGLIPPVSGQAVYGDGLRQNEIGYLPQQTQIQKDFPACVREVVRSGCLNRVGLRPFYNRAEKQMAHAHMVRLGIEQLEKRCYRNLSGGQQQRVLLARALCATRTLLLLDEPAAGLDPQAMHDMYELIAALNRMDGITVVMISHDIQAAVKYASHILHLGVQPCFFGKTAAYLQTAEGKAYTGKGDNA